MFNLNDVRNQKASLEIGVFAWCRFQRRGLAYTNLLAYLKTLHRSNQEVKPYILPEELFSEQMLSYVGLKRQAMVKVVNRMRKDGFLIYNKKGNKYWMASLKVIRATCIKKDAQYGLVKMAFTGPFKDVSEFNRCLSKAIIETDAKAVHSRQTDSRRKPKKAMKVLVSGEFQDASKSMCDIMKQIYDPKKHYFRADRLVRQMGCSLRMVYKILHESGVSLGREDFKRIRGMSSDQIRSFKKGFGTNSRTLMCDGLFVKPNYHYA